MSSKSDDVLVSDPPHRSVCRHCCPTHDELRAEVERLNSAIDALSNVIVTANGEIERLRAETKAYRETAAAAIAGSEKEVERLRAALQAQERAGRLIADEHKKDVAELLRLREAAAYVVKCAPGEDCDGGCVEMLADALPT